VRVLDRRDPRDAGPRAARLVRRAGARFVAVIGPREAEVGAVSIRRLGEEGNEEVRLGDVVNWLAEHDPELPAVPRDPDEDDR
jgi:hypothetical protein